jgi:phage terminase large subunit-like protein
MGLKGIGSAKVAALRKSLGTKRQRPFSWQRRGLTRAERVILFMESLTITAGPLAGTKLKLRPWQRRIIEGIYAEEPPDVGRLKINRRRLVRTALVSTPRKNGKTQLAAGLALAHLCGPEAEPRGQVYSAASDRDQAAIIFREMAALLDAEPRLAVQCNVQHFAKSITHLPSGSIYQALSADARKAHGLGASFVVYDELAQARDRTLYDNLLTSMGARAEPLAVVISTQSSDPNHVMSELVDYGERVLRGEIEDPTFFAAIYSAPQDAEAWDEATWFACNPALDDFRSLEELRRFAEQAKRIPAREATFRALYLNQRVDAAQRFIGSADWEACAGVGAPPGTELRCAAPPELRGRPCYAGLDLSSTTDLTALALYFPEDAGALVCFFWLPDDHLAEREARDRVPYRLWRDQGLLITTPGRAIDKRSVAAKLAELSAEYDIRGIAHDRWRIADFQKVLADEGIELPLVECGQGFKDLGPCVDAFETAVLNRKIAHGGNPILRWNISNVAIEVDPAGNRKPTKEKSIGRIDGAVAAIMAVGLHAREPAPQEYDFERPLVLSA